LAQRLRPRADLHGFALLALDRRERGGERVGGRLAVAALAALVEVHRRGVQQLQHRELLGRARVLAVVVARERVERELVVAGDVPQELRVEREASAPACATASTGPGAAKRISTFAALTLRRRPVDTSTCSDASASASTAPALSWPSSSNSTFMGRES
jgi:hypothetical protein